MSDLKIVKNVPLPPRSSSHIPKLPLDDMEVGDSFTVTEKMKSDRATIRQRLYRYQVQNKPKLFIIRKEKGKLRIFRAEDAS